MSVDGPKPACNADMCDDCARKAARLHRQRIGLKRLARDAKASAKNRTNILILSGAIEPREAFE